MWSPGTIDEIFPGMSADIHVTKNDSENFQIDMLENGFSYEFISSDLQGILSFLPKNSKKILKK